MKKFFLFAAAALLAACSGDDLTVKEQPQVQEEPGAIGFDVYMERGVTRSGLTGDLTSTRLGTVDNDGFGVFGYYTDNKDYDQLAIPNFFYNQRVYAKTATNTYEYEPVRYWPNEYGDKAISDDVDRVTFFAYAPCVDVEPTTGKLSQTDI